MSARLLCLVPDVNTIKKDMTGAFLPEAIGFARFHGADPAKVIKRFPALEAPGVRRRVAAAHLRALTAPIDTLACFCHGYRAGLQAGWNVDSVLALATLLREHATPDAYVLLYACHAGRDADADELDDVQSGPGGDGGFADRLRDACESIGLRVTVMAHTTAGHTAQNPYARRFSPGFGGKGGTWYVEPKSPLWPRWVRALREPGGTLKWRFPRMTAAEIAAELQPHVA